MKITVAVFFGCSSVEHEVSIISGVQAMQSIDRNRYDPVPIYITKSGEMKSGNELFDIETYKDMDQLAKTSISVTLVRQNGNVYMIDLEKKPFKKPSKVRIDVALPVAHGTNGEDGTLAGYFELLGLPYAGCNILSSATGMDKSIFKSVLTRAGIPVLECVTLSSRRFSSDPNSVISEIEQKLSYPLIIKPVNLGSSVGISKVESRDELINAIKLAAEFADNLLAEPAIVNLREINCSVLGDAQNCETSVLEEPIMHDKILSYEDKYTSSGKSKGMASLGRKIPAELPENKAEEIKNIAKKTFSAIGALGVVRIDFLIDTAQDNRVFVNEINTIPGSLSFYLWEPAGINYSELLTKMIELAFKRERNRANLMFTLNTNLLSKTGFGSKGSKGAKI